MSDIEISAAKLANDIMPQIRALVMEKTAANIASSIQYAVQNAVAERVSAYVKEKVMPDVQSALVDAHATMVKGAVDAVNVAAESMRVAMVKHVTDQAADKYRMQKVIDGLFGKGY